MHPQQRPNVADAKPVPWGNVSIWAGIVVTGILILLLTVVNFLPVFRTGGTETPDTLKVDIPELDLFGWQAMAVQHSGRYKPFQSAAREVMRNIVGRERIQGEDAVAVVLMWMFDGDPARPDRPGAWEKVPFILCENRDLRELIYRIRDDGSLSNDAPTPEQVHGKFISPEELRRFLERVATVARGDRDRYKEVFKPHDREIGEVQGRLALYDGIRGKEAAPDRKPNDHFAFVALDKVAGAPWFSAGELRYVRDDPAPPARWQSEVMKERAKNAPQLYMSPPHKQALSDFQQRVKAGTAAAVIDELAPGLRARWEGKPEEFVKLRRAGNNDKATEELFKLLEAIPGITDPEAFKDAPDLRASRERLRALLAADDKAAAGAERIAEGLRAVLADRDAWQLAELKKQLPAKNQSYEPDDPKFRMLHLTYLEMRHPDLYSAAAVWQPFPAPEASRVLASYNAVGQAYRARNPEAFAKATEDFRTTAAAVSERFGHEYPGKDGIGDRLSALFSGDTINTPGEELLQLELTFNRVQPFKWAWITMLGALILLAISLGVQSRVWYVGGLSLYGVSVLFQLFGYFVRIVIAGRPPVTNMYETVIWVAFMTGIFALILEGVYRKRVIALAGALVSTICLVLADQMPLALDPKISPLVPVLRSNFWLFIHVLTIVSSYAGGALAWGFGNVALLLILFAPNKRETIKTLSTFTYRALQIAVLLLAAGTFLGGWWAAYSWGRFWGWDPKETGALIALLCYVIPLHMRYIGWIKDFGLAVAAIVCFAAILIAWYGINFVVPAGLHAYGFGSGGAAWVYWASLLNIEWVLVATLIYRAKMYQPASVEPPLVADAASGSANGAAKDAEKTEYVKA